MGQQLCDDLQPVYVGLRDSLERALRTARDVAATLRVGMMPGNAHDLRSYWDTFCAQYPQWQHSVRYWPRPDIVWLPFRDLGPLAYAMVWRADTENDRVRALARIVRDLGPLHLGDR